MPVPIIALVLLLVSCAGEGGPEGMSVAYATDDAAFSTPVDTTPTIVRRVLAEPDVDWLVSPSPDGRLIARTDWVRGDLVVRDLDSGEEIRLTTQPAPYASGFPMFPRWAPDGSRIAYGWYDAEKPWEWELRTIRPNGSDPTTLVSGVPYIQPEDWSPDGRTILALQSNRDGTNEIVLVDAEAGDARTLKTLDWRAPFRMNFSPDARWIAYDLPSGGDSRERDVFTLAVHGGEERLAAGGPDDDQLLGWGPTDHLLFASDRAGTPGAWVVGMRDGRPDGDAVLVQPDFWRAVPIEFVDQDSYLYGVRIGAREVRTVQLDPADGSVLTSAAPVEPRGVWETSRPRWSPDGARLAYVMQPSAPTRSGAFGSWTVAIRSEAGVRELPLPREMTWPAGYRWTPDGRALLLLGQDRDAGRGFHRVDILTGEAEVVFRKPAGEWMGAFDLSPDGRYIAFKHERRLDGGRNEQTLVLRELASGVERTLRQLPVNSDLQFRNVAFSPDGGRLAVVEWNVRGSNAPNRVLVLSIPEGTWEEVARGRYEEPVWLPDGQTLLLQRHASPEDAHEILERLDLATGRTEPVGLEGENMGAMAVHPNGDRLAFVAGQPTYELWMMENFVTTLDEEGGSE